jgi:hypothetical protein
MEMWIYLIVGAIIYYIYVSSTVYTKATTATVSDIVCSGLRQRCNYKYTYTVDGKAYSNKVYRGLRPSSTITIKYNPTKPEESII